MIKILIILIASWDIATIVFDSSLFDPIRNRILRGNYPPKLQELVLCKFCLSFYTSLLTLLLYSVLPEIVYLFALHGGTVILNSVIFRFFDPFDS